MDAKEVSEVAKAAADIAKTIVASPIVEAIPVVGSAVELLVKVGGLQDWLNLRKIKNFVATYNQAHVDEMFKRAAHSPEEMTDLGERALLVVMGSQDFLKPVIHGKLFIAFAVGELTFEELGRFLSIIAPAHTPDLERLASVTNPFFDRPNRMALEAEEPWYVAPEVGLPLTIYGLTAPVSFGGAYGEISQKYSVTRAGLRFHAALVIANQKLGEYHPPNR